VDRARGRFRTFILTTLTRFLSKEYKKERRRVATVPITIPGNDQEWEVERIELAGDETPEDVFNRTWARNLIEQTLLRMEETCTKGKSREYCRVFKAFLDSSTDVSPKSYRELGETLGMSETDVTNYLHRGRNIFQKLLRSEVRHSLFHETELDQELEELREYFS
jgi:DNA-directed RNA polymerase specialized sigma24 family protein